MEQVSNNIILNGKEYAFDRIVESGNDFLAYQRWQGIAPKNVLPIEAKINLEDFFKKEWLDEYPTVHWKEREKKFNGYLNLTTQKIIILPEQTFKRGYEWVKISELTIYPNEAYFRVIESQNRNGIFYLIFKKRGDR